MILNKIFRSHILKKCNLLDNVIAKCQMQQAKLISHLPRRAILFVPGDSRRKIAKASTLNADVIAFDCEDGVAVNKKEDARNLIRVSLDTGRYVLDPIVKKRIPEFSVRVNSVDSGLIEDDLKTLCSGPHPPSTIVLPKIEAPIQIHQFGEMLTKYLTPGKKVNLIMYAETALGLLNLPDVLKYTKEVGPAFRFEPVALIFGSDDYCASIGATRTENSLEVLYARQKVVMIAKAFDLQAIDMVYINFKDLEGLRRQSIEGAQMGFTGKQIIHPDQIQTVHQTFLPAPQKVEWAKELVKAFDEHQAKGAGAFAHKGMMIDMPTIRQAQNIINLVKSLE